MVRPRLPFQASQGNLEIEVAGPNPADRDLLVVNGNVDLTGTLLLMFSGYAPSASESFPVMQVAGNYSESNLKIVVLGLKPGFQCTHQFTGGQLVITTITSGQLRNATDPIQTLPPWLAPNSEFVFPVYALAGATYQFDTSTDLRNWTRISEQAGANALVEFRHVPPPGEPARFYRVVQISGTP